MPFLLLGTYSPAMKSLSRVASTPPYAPDCQVVTSDTAQNFASGSTQGGGRKAYIERPKHPLRAYFPTGRADFNLKFKSNTLFIDSLTALLDRYAANGVVIEQVDICGGASPEGMLHMNRALAAKRAVNVRRQIQSLKPLNDTLFHTRDCGIYWEGLEQLVAESDMKHRDEVLEILRTVPEQIFSPTGKWVDGRRHRLEMLHGGRTWHEMSRRFFPELRSCEIVSFKCNPPEYSTGIYTVPNSDEKINTDSDATGRSDTLHAGTDKGNTVNNGSDTPNAGLEVSADSIALDTDNLSQSVPNTGLALFKKSPNKTYFALKTNLLYDAVGLPNLGVEVQRGQWSLTASGLYGWWRNWTRPHINAASGEMALRRWFGRDSKETPFAGHHIGATAQVAAFDLKGTGAEGRYAPWGSWCAGLEYGYALQLCQGLTLDLTAGVGYAEFTLKRYERQDDCDVLLGTRRVSTVAPVKAEVSLIWTLNR